MTKTELINKLSAELNISKKMAAEMLSSFIDIVTESLKKDEAVRIQGFGTYSVSHRAAREDPSKKIKIPARKVPTFKAGKGLKEALN